MLFKAGEKDVSFLSKSVQQKENIKSEQAPNSSKKVQNGPQSLKVSKISEGESEKYNTKSQKCSHKNM